MTEEKVLELLEKEKAYALSHGGDMQAIALDEAIKAVKQRSIVDKIRAEIEYSMQWAYATGDDEYAEGFEKSLEVIDKY